MFESPFQQQVISDPSLWVVPSRYTRRNIVILKFGGTTAGATKEEGRIRLARDTIARLTDEGKTVIPVFSAFRRGRSQSSEKISVTDILQNYRETIRENGSLQAGADEIIRQLWDIHFQLIEDLKITSDMELGSDVAEELERIRQTMIVCGTSCERIPCLDDFIITAGERLMVKIMAGYLRHSHANGKFPMSARAATAMELGIHTNSNFGEADIEWGRAIENTREIIFARYLEQGVMPIVSGFDGIYDPHDQFGNFQPPAGSNEATYQEGRVFRTSLGRGGSDLTASFLGLALDAEYVGFCKETPGVLTGDDRLLGEQARTIPNLDYELATEAGNIYARAIEPVRAGSVPVHIFDPKNPEIRTVISNKAVPVGVYLIERPIPTVNIHVGPIPDRPGELGRLLQLFAERRINVEEVRHQRCGTDCIVTGSDEDLQETLQHLSGLGYRLFSQFTWYVRAIGIIDEALAAKFNTFMSGYEPLTLSTYQLGTRVLTATVARNRASEHIRETDRVEDIVKCLHDELIAIQANTHEGQSLKAVPVPEEAQRPTTSNPKDESSIEHPPAKVKEAPAEQPPEGTAEEPQLAGAQLNEVIGGKSAVIDKWSCG